MRAGGRGGGARAGGSPASGVAPPGPPAHAPRPALRTHPSLPLFIPYIPFTNPYFLTDRSALLLTVLLICENSSRGTPEVNFCEIIKPARPNAQISQTKPRIGAKKSVLLAFLEISNNFINYVTLLPLTLRPLDDSIWRSRGAASK